MQEPDGENRRRQKREVLNEAKKQIDANRKSPLGREALYQSVQTLQYPGATVLTTETATGKLYVWILIIASTPRLPCLGTSLVQSFLIGNYITSSSRTSCADYVFPTRPLVIDIVMAFSADLE